MRSAEIGIGETRQRPLGLELIRNQHCASHHERRTHIDDQADDVEQRAVTQEPALARHSSDQAEVNSAFRNIALAEHRALWTPGRP